MKTHCLWYYSVTVTSTLTTYPPPWWHLPHQFKPWTLPWVHLQSHEKRNLGMILTAALSNGWETALVPQGTYQTLPGDTTGTTAPERRTRQNHHIVKISSFAFYPTPCVTQWNYNIPSHYLPSFLRVYRHNSEDLIWMAFTLARRFLLPLVTFPFISWQLELSNNHNLSP